MKEKIADRLSELMQVLYDYCISGVCHDKKFERYCKLYDEVGSSMMVVVVYLEEHGIDFTTYRS